MKNAFLVVLGSCLFNVPCAVSAAVTIPAPLTGGYQALLFHGDEGSGGTPAARVTLNVTSAGSYSGSLFTVENKTYPLTGKLAVSETGLTATQTINRTTAPRTPLNVGIAISPGGVLSVTLNGDIGVFTSPGAPTPASAANGFHNLVLAPRTTAAFQGKYTLALRQAAALRAGEPGGCGYATVTVSPTGILSLSGKLGDGRTLTASLTAGQAQNFILLASPYAAAASYVGGRLAFTSRPDSGFHITTADSGSSLRWTKAPKSTDTSYRGGIPSTQLNVVMEPWRTPPPRPLPVPTLGTFLGLPEGKVFNLAFAGDAFNTASYAAYLPLKLGMTKLNKFRVAAAGNSAPSPILDTAWASIFSLNVNPATGKLTGTLKIKDTVPNPVAGRPPLIKPRTLTLDGVLLQHPVGADGSFVCGVLGIPPLTPPTQTATTAGFFFDGPVMDDPFVAAAAATAGKYTVTVRQYSNGGTVPYASNAPADGEAVALELSADLKVLTFRGRRLTLEGDSRPVSLVYSNLPNVTDNLTVILYTHTTTGALTGGYAKYQQAGVSGRMPVIKISQYDFPKSGTSIIRR